MCDSAQVSPFGLNSKLSVAFTLEVDAPVYHPSTPHDASALLSHRGECVDDVSLDHLD